MGLTTWGSRHGDHIMGITRWESRHGAHSMGLMTWGSLHGAHVATNCTRYHSSLVYCRITEYRGIRDCSIVCTLYIVQCTTCTMYTVHCTVLRWGHLIH